MKGVFSPLLHLAKSRTCCNWLFLGSQSHCMKHTEVLFYYVLALIIWPDQLEALSLARMIESNFSSFRHIHCIIYMYCILQPEHENVTLQTLQDMWRCCSVISQQQAPSNTRGWAWPMIYRVFCWWANFCASEGEQSGGCGSGPPKQLWEIA